MMIKKALNMASGYAKSRLVLTLLALAFLGLEQLIGGSGIVKLIGLVAAGLVAAMVWYCYKRNWKVDGRVILGVLAMAAIIAAVIFNLKYGFNG